MIRPPLSSGALELAESIQDSPTKIALLIDIAALQAKGSDEPAARATLMQALRAAGAVQDTGKRCELLMRMSESMLGAGAPEAAAWVLQEVESRIVRRQAGQGWIGIKMENFRKDAGAEAPSGGLDGALVLEVDANGPAAQAGIEDGDVVTMIGGQRISSAAALVKRLAMFAPGERIAVELVREGEVKVLQVEFGIRASAKAEESNCRAGQVDRLLRAAVFYAGLGDRSSSDRQLEVASQAVLGVAASARLSSPRRAPCTLSSSASAASAAASQRSTSACNSASRFFMRS